MRGKLWEIAANIVGWMGFFWETLELGMYPWGRKWRPTGIFPGTNENSSLSFGNLTVFHPRERGGIGTFYKCLGISTCENIMGIIYG